MALIELDFLDANQIVAALENRATSFSVIHPMDLVTLREINRCRRIVVDLRAAFHFPTEAHLDAAHEAAMAEMDELADDECIPPAKRRAPPTRRPCGSGHRHRWPRTRCAHSTVIGDEPCHVCPTCGGRGFTWSHTKGRQPCPRCGGSGSGLSR